MVKKYKVDGRVRVLNWMMRSLAKRGSGPKAVHLLTGKLYSNPVSLVVEGDVRWLVSPYGEVNWVRNARAAGRVTRARGKHTEEVGIVELNAKDSAPVLKKYLVIEPITRSYFGVTPDASLADFEEDALNHPVFLIREVG